MVKKGLCISSRSAEAVESYLHGDKLTPEISKLLAQLTSGELSPEPIQTMSSPVGVLSLNRVSLSRILITMNASM